MVKSFDGDVYLFADLSIPATITDPWGKISFDLWGETFKFYFKAENLTPAIPYTLKVGGIELGSFTADENGAGSCSGAAPIDASFTNQDVTLTGGPDLTSFYPISFLYIAPTP